MIGENLLKSSYLPKPLFNIVKMIPVKFWIIVIMCYFFPFLIEIMTDGNLQVEIQTDITWILTIVPSIIFTYYLAIKQGIISSIFTMVLHIFSGTDFDQDEVIFQHEIISTVEVALVSILFVFVVGMLSTKLKAEKRFLETSNKELNKQKEQLNNIFNNLDLAIWSYDLETNKIELSSYFENLYGMQRESMIDRPTNYWKDAVVAEDSDKVREFEKHLLAGIPHKETFRIEDLNGEIHWVQDRGIPVMDSFGRLIRIDGVMMDITDAKKFEREMEKLAFYDQLTSLPNRRFFSEKMSDALSIAKDTRAPLAVLFIDLDGFKKVNDTYGHHAGDSLLQQVAKRLSSSIRDGDLVSRLAGDEFTIMLPNTKKLNAVNIATRILQSLQQLFPIGDQDVSITPSIGLAMYPEHGNDVQTLIKNADAAMYQAKLSGKNSYQICSNNVE
jgi:diguanylate cyclase (GGDEF)-like protein/PAS domain S-box-containing protein